MFIFAKLNLNYKKMEKKEWVSPELNDINVENTQGGNSTFYAVENPTYTS
jgi:hypothetical protein